MRLILRALSLLLLAPGIANAQAADDMRIVVGGFKLTTNGAEKPAGVTRIVNLVRPSSASRGPPCSQWSDAGTSRSRCRRTTFEDNAHAGWRVEITPTKVVQITP